MGQSEYFDNQRVGPSARERKKPFLCSLQVDQHGCLFHTRYVFVNNRKAITPTAVHRPSSSSQPIITLISGSTEGGYSASDILLTIRYHGVRGHIWFLPNEHVHKNCAC